MKTSRWLMAASTTCLSLPTLAVNPHPDPQNPTGYIIARSDIQNSEASKTSNPMYRVWAEALQTASNSVVDSIDAGLATNPSNVKRAERVFPRDEWDFLTHMAAP
ncbi:carbohydrate-binding protein, partial [Vibrio alfacsensis]